MGKSEVEAMTEREIAAKQSWQRRRASPPGVPGMPWTSFILTLRAFWAATSVVGGASTGWTNGRLTYITLQNLSAHPLYKDKSDLDETIKLESNEKEKGNFEEGDEEGESLGEFFFF